MGRTYKTNHAKELNYDNVKACLGEASGFATVTALLWGSNGAVAFVYEFGSYMEWWTVLQPADFLTEFPLKKLPSPPVFPDSIVNKIKELLN